MPTVFPPGDTTLLDDFNRSDDTAWAGAGSTLWSPLALDGSASLLRVSGNKLVATAEGGGLTTENVADGVRMITSSTTASGYLMFFFRMSGGNGYGLAMQGGTWSLYAISSGGTVFTSVDTHASLDTLSNGTRIGIRFQGTTVDVHIGNAKYLSPTPVWQATGLTTTTAGACGWQVGSSLWALDDYQAGGLSFPTTPVTIYVDPDNGSASDLRSRAEASNPATPMKTVQEAGWLVRAASGWADTILVKECATADLGDSLDPHIQPALDYRSTDRNSAAIGWPFGNNAGNAPIVLKGDPGATNLPKLKAFHSRELSNWSVEDLQIGYDQGSGHDYRTTSAIERVTDMAFRRCTFTGGLALVQHWTNAFIVEDCYIRAPMPPTGTPGGVHDGSGLILGGNPGEGTGYSIGQFTCQRNTFEFVRGDDAINVGGVEDPADPLYATFDMLVQDNIFININADGPYHTDSIQILGVPRCKVTRNAFISCDTALIASDFRNGHVEFTRNLTVGIDTPLQLQGCDSVLIAHNTFNETDAFVKDSSILFYDRTVLPTDTVATIVNNIIGGFYMRDRPLNSYFSAGTVIADNIIMSNPGLTSTWGTNLSGLVEYGTTTRLNTIPVDTLVYGTVLRNWELSNTPVLSPGIGQGRTTTLTTDFFGRTYASPPDVGAFQSSGSVAVTPAARPPYLLSKSPAASAVNVSATTNVVLVFYPLPGQSLNASTVTPRVTLTDPDGFVITSSVTVGSLDGSGQQTVTLNPNGTLFPLVNYTAHAGSGIQDTAGNTYLGLDWSFRIVGPGAAAIYPDGGAPDPLVQGIWYVSVV